jgi:serine/threonine protein kinase
VERLLDVAIQVARGLQEAHSKGVVHRDIKPANIMDTPSGQAVLMDFGLAQLASVASKLTREGTTLGTSVYMSPEQTSGEKLDQRTDIWALGVVLYEMATGQVPFQGHYEQAILYSILYKAPKPITALRTGVPPDLERITNKCLAKRAEERYQTVSDLLADLSTLQRATESAAGTRPSSAAKDTRPSIAVLPFENHGRGDEDEYFSDGISEDITSALGKVEGLQVAPRSMAFYRFFMFAGKRRRLSTTVSIRESPACS